jgi:four helix bundle protein
MRGHSSSPAQSLMRTPSAEADAASSDADFVAKMRIAARESKEACVAIRIIAACNLLGAAAIGKHLDEANQLASIYSTIVRNKKANMKARS